MFFAVSKSRDSPRGCPRLEFGVPGGTVCVYIFIPADVGRTRLFLLPSKSRDLPCGSPHRLFIF